MSDDSYDDQPLRWSDAAEQYAELFVDPDLPGVVNPVRPALAALAGSGCKSVVDLGCGTGPLLPFLAERFDKVFAVDFAEGMLRRAKKNARGLGVKFVQTSMDDLSSLPEGIDVVAAVNSLVMPDVNALKTCLREVRRILRPGGTFLGIVPAIDSVHYLTMLLVDRARSTGMPPDAARKNAALHAEHDLFEFAFSEFRYRGLVQHFWQPFEIEHRLRDAGFAQVRLEKAVLTWDQCSKVEELYVHPPPWDWFFSAVRE